jgi:diphthine synthase
VDGMSRLGELTFVGLGLNSEKNMSILGLEEAKKAETAFVELYTSLMPELDLNRLGKLIGKHVHVVLRRDLEEDSGKRILQSADKGKTVLLVPGDPLMATTHVDLRIRAEKQGIKTKIIHGASIVSAVIGLSGLQNYKFGRGVTIPFSDVSSLDATPYNVIGENQKMGLHTLCFLDIRAEEKRYMTIKDALDVLSTLEKKKQQRVVTGNMLAVGIARAGSDNPAVKADFVEQLQKFNFGKPPHTLVFPGKLHFMEAEALVTLGKAPQEILEMVK